MPRVARAALATLPAILAASCTLLSPLDRLTGGQGAPDGGDAAYPDVGGAEDAPPDAGPPGEAAADAQGDAASDAADGGPDADAADGGRDADAAASPYATAVLGDAPLAYWRLDEPSGTVCHDSSGHGNDATYLGAVGLGVAGPLVGDPDTAAQFNGADAKIDVGDKFDFAGSAPFSIEMWARPDVIDSTYRHVETKMLYTDAGQPGTGIYFYFHAGNGLGFERWNNNFTDDGLGDTAVTTAQWLHVVGTFDGATMTLYVNGAQVMSKPTAIVVAANGVHLLWAQSFQGALDELAIYDHALPSARVQAHYQAAQ